RKTTWGDVHCVDTGTGFLKRQICRPDEIRRFQKKHRLLAASINHGEGFECRPRHLHHAARIDGELLKSRETRCAGSITPDSAYEGNFSSQRSESSRYV